MASHQSLSQQDLPKVLVFGPPLCFPIISSRLCSKFHFLKPWESPFPLPQFLSAHAASVRALLTNASSWVTAEELNLLPSLGIIVASSTGVDRIDLSECRKRGITVANAAGVFAEDVADLAVGLLIGVFRKIPGADRYVTKGAWPKFGEYPLGHKLGGKRVGIVGLGQIGSKVAKRLQAFGCIISYMSRSMKASVSYPFYDNIFELAAKNDALILCCELNDQTRHMINRDVLLALGKEGVIVNVGRGPIIDEKELVQCLLQGEIGGAGLDVFENEPNVPEELFALDNVVMSPHCAVFTPESEMALCELIRGNLEAFFSNKPLLHQLEIK